MALILPPLAVDGVVVDDDGAFAHVKARVVAVVGGAEHAADDVLAGVLLHVVKAVLPVDAPVNGLALGQGLVAGVEDYAVLFLHVGDFCRPQRAVVGGLAAAFGVKSGLIQRHQPLFAVGTAGEDAPVKFPQKRIFII